MRCLNCGANIPQNSATCPYCGISVSESVKNCEMENDILSKRFVQIDVEFGLNTEYEMLPTDRLKEFLDTIEAKFESFNQARVLDAVQTNKIMSRISEVEETLQKRFPVRAEVKRIRFPLDGKSVSQRVLLNLDKISPPDIYTAAYILRSAVERKFRDDYKFAYTEENRNSHFVKSYYEMFSIIIGNNEVAYKCAKKRGILNLFIHQSTDNDRKIRQYYPRTEDSVDFIKKSLYLFEKYKLI